VASPASWTVGRAYAHTEVVASRLSAERLRALCGNDPTRRRLAVLHALAEDAAAKARQTSQHLEEFVFSDHIDPSVDHMVAAAAAPAALAGWPEARVEALLEQIAQVAAVRAGELAVATVGRDRDRRRRRQDVQEPLRQPGGEPLPAGQAGGGTVVDRRARGYRDRQSGRGGVGLGMRCGMHKSGKYCSEGVVGAGGVEPPSSSVSAKPREPLCYATFSQVTLDRSCGREALDCPEHDARLLTAHVELAHVDEVARRAQEGQASRIRNEN
jgi:hypothetical protein